MYLAYFILLQTSYVIAFASRAVQGHLIPRHLNVSHSAPDHIECIDQGTLCGLFNSTTGQNKTESLSARPPTIAKRWAGLEFKVNLVGEELDRNVAEPLLRRAYLQVLQDEREQGGQTLVTDFYSELDHIAFALIATPVRSRGDPNLTLATLIRTLEFVRSYFVVWAQNQEYEIQLIVSAVMDDRVSKVATGALKKSSALLEIKSSTSVYSAGP